jgi:hypothetical protein
VAATAERFRGSPWGGTYRLKDVLAVADELANELPDRGGPRLLDLLSKATTSNADCGAPVRGAPRDESPLSAGVVEERRRPTPVRRRPRQRRQTFLERLALGSVVGHGVRPGRARRRPVRRKLAGQQLRHCRAGCPGSRCRRARRTRRRSPASANSPSTRRGSRRAARERPRRPRPGAARRRRASSRRPRSR